MNEQSQSPLQQRVLRQRTLLFNMLIDPMHRAAVRAAKVWDQKGALDAELEAAIKEVPYCTYLYAFGRDKVQISANASQNGLIEDDFGRNRLSRPYILTLDPNRDMQLSDAYISMRANRPSVTAIKKVYRNGQHVGCLGADFDLRDLPITKDLYTEPGRWRQIKGDPAIRSQLFQQCRIQSRADSKLDTIVPTLEELVTDHGVFHVKIHFSSSRATLWFMSDPYRYQILDYDELVDPDIVLAYPHFEYPENALVQRDEIRPILDTFCQLRLADNTIYLRAGSVNIFNGLVGLNFSCDGSHYVPHTEFLARDSEFWKGM